MRWFIVLNVVAVVDSTTSSAPGGDLARFGDTHVGNVDGCRNAYLDASTADEFRDEAYGLLTREGLRAGAAPTLADYKESKVSTVNGTRFTYALNRKAASRTLQRVERAIHQATGSVVGPTNMHSRVVLFTFARHPLKRLESGYREIVAKHVDGQWCSGGRSSHKGDLICTAPYVRMKRNSIQRFEAFLNATLLGPMEALEDDSMSYHVLSQSRQFMAHRNLAFVGHIETLRADVIKLLGLALDDPEAFVEENAELKELLAEDETNWTASGPHPFRKLPPPRRLAGAKNGRHASNLPLLKGAPQSLGPCTDRNGALQDHRVCVARNARHKSEPVRPRGPPVFATGAEVLPSAKNYSAFLGALSPFSRALVLDYYRQDAACLGYEWPPR